MLFSGRSTDVRAGLLGSNPSSFQLCDLGPVLLTETVFLPIEWGRQVQPAHRVSGRNIWAEPCVYLE